MWSLITSAVGGALGYQDNKKYIKMQKEENEKTRQHNLQLANMQNQWNLEQWNRENNYNSPVAQMSRYAQAGLNPDLIYSKDNLAGASPAMTSGSAATPTDTSGRKHMSDIFANSANLALALSQARKNNEEADVIEKTKPSVVEEAKQKVEEIKSKVSLTRKQESKLANEIDNLVQTNNNLKEQFNVIKQQAASMKEDVFEKKLNNAIKSAVQDKAIRNALKQADYSLQEAEGRARQAIATALSAESTADLLKLDVENEKDFRSLITQVGKNNALGIFLERIIRMFEGTNISIGGTVTKKLE